MSPTAYHAGCSSSPPSPRGRALKRRCSSRNSDSRYSALGWRVRDSGSGRSEGFIESVIRSSSTPVTSTRAACPDRNNWSGFRTNPSASSMLRMRPVRPPPSSTKQPRLGLTARMMPSRTSPRATLPAPVRPASLARRRPRRRERTHPRGARRRSCRHTSSFSRTSPAARVPRIPSAPHEPGWSPRWWAGRNACTRGLERRTTAPSSSTACTLPRTSSPRGGRTSSSAGSASASGPRGAGVRSMDSRSRRLPELEYRTRQVTTCPSR
mmetsp:Transcript_6791/g.19227  ORF Transcript_6791/g.19227 Transcript_6791/m.19227 type:complete len:267 (-) Transcript_6791:215-1015(-)